MNNKIFAYLAIIFTCSIWGLSYLSSKVLLDFFHPMALAFYRNIIAMILMLLANLIYKNSLRINKKDIPRFFFAGLFGITLYFTFENYGIGMTSASVASIIIATIPIISMLTDIIIMKNRVTNYIVIGTLLSFIGVILVINKGNSHMTLLGLIFMLMAAFSWVIFNYVTKPLYKNYSRLTITTYQIIFGTISLTPFTLTHIPDINLILNPSVILNLLFLSIFCSAIGFFLYVYALENLNVTVTTLFVNCIPLISVSSSVLLLGESVSFMQIIGGLLIIMSVTISSLPKKIVKQVQSS